MSEKLYGQSYLKRDGEVIAIIRENGNSSYSVAGTEGMNLNDARKVLDDYCTLEKNPEIFIAVPDETVLIKFKDGNLEYFKNALPLDRKMYAEDTSEMIENLFRQKMIFEPVNEKIKTVTYSIGGYTDNVDDFKGMLKGKLLDNGKVSVEEYLIEKNGETKGYFNDDNYDSSGLTLAEAYTMSRELTATKNNKLLESDLEARSDKIFEHITNIGEFGFDLKNCNENNFEELSEAAKIFQRTTWDYENMEIDAGPELGIRFAQKMPELWIDCNDGSQIKYNESKNEIYMGNTLHKLSSIEQMAEMLKTVSENCDSNKNIRIQVDGEKLTKKNNSEWLIYSNKKFHEGIKEEFIVQRDFRSVIATDGTKEKIVCFREGEMLKEDLETLKKDKNFNKITVIEGEKIVSEIKKQKETQSKKTENKKNNYASR